MKTALIKIKTESDNTLSVQTVNPIHPNNSQIMKDMMDNLEKIKSSPIVDDAYYCTMHNLCGAIKAITFGLYGVLERKKCIEDSVNDIRNGLYQIDTLADIIEEKIIVDDFVNLSNVVYHYNDIILQSKQ